MPAIFSFPLAGVAPRKPSTALGTIIKPAVDKVAPRRNWRRVNWDWVLFVLFFIEVGGFMPECPLPHGRPRPSGGNGGPGTDTRGVRDRRRGGAGLSPA